MKRSSPDPAFDVSILPDLRKASKVIYFCNQSDSFSNLFLTCIDIRILWFLLIGLCRHIVLASPPVYLSVVSKLNDDQIQLVQKIGFGHLLSPGS